MNEWTLLRHLPGQEGDNWLSTPQHQSRLTLHSNISEEEVPWRSQEFQAEGRQACFIINKGRQGNFHMSCWMSSPREALEAICWRWQSEPLNDCRLEDQPPLPPIPLPIPTNCTFGLYMKHKINFYCINLLSSQDLSVTGSSIISSVYRNWG